MRLIIIIVILILIIVFGGLYAYTYRPTCSECKCSECKNTVCPPCRQHSGFLPVISSDGTSHSSPLNILQENIAPDQNEYTKFFGSGWTDNSDGKKSCSQNSIFSRIISRVDTSTPLDPLRDEYLCMRRYYL